MSRDCMQCATTESWEKCNADMKSVTCNYGQDSCYKLTVESSVLNTYTKGCATETNCASSQDFADLCGNVADCEVLCCDSDDCNGAEGFQAKILVVLAMSVLAVIVSFFATA